MGLVGAPMILQPRCTSLGNPPQNPFIGFVTHKFPPTGDIGDALIPAQDKRGTEGETDAGQKNCKCKERVGVQSSNLEEFPLIARP